MRPPRRWDERVPELEFWDCHAGIGRWTLPPPAGALDVAGLRAELAYAGIAGALVHHGLGRDYDPAAGNEVLLRELAAAEGWSGIELLDRSPERAANDGARSSGGDPLFAVVARRAGNGE